MEEQTYGKETKENEEDQEEIIRGNKTKRKSRRRRGTQSGRG